MLDAEMLERFDKRRARQWHLRVVVTLERVHFIEQLDKNARTSRRRKRHFEHKMANVPLDRQLVRPASRQAVNKIEKLAKWLKKRIFRDDADRFVCIKIDLQSETCELCLHIQDATDLCVHKLGDCVRIVAD